MIVWIVLTVLITLAAVALVIPLLRPRTGAGQGGATAVGILKDQLAELEAQEKSGAVTADEAARLKLEIERRMLAEARDAEAPARPLKDRTLLLLAFGVAGGVALGAAGLYAIMGKPGTPAATQQAQSMAAAGDHPGGGDIQSQILQLQQQLSANPNDAEGWRLLGWSYFQTGAFNEAAVAYGRAATLDPQNADHVSAQGESLIQAAGGQVTPEAEAAFRAALRINPQDPRARYFLAVLKDQSGDADGAMSDWIDLVNSAPPGAPWVGEVRRFVEDLAQQRGIDISTRLKPASTAATGSAMPGPNAEQVAAAQSMAPEDRDAMIRGMVDGLEQKLRANPRDPEGWVRLMRARMVLGDRTAAATALRNARAGLSGDASGLAQVNEAARGLGVPGA